jgi:succinate-semialdehyde dehydrogenase/glutarate-semialdehyde dehydrogenase
MGGNDAFVVLKDANLPAAVEAAYRSRMSNSGQACNAAKRFIITAPVYDKFKDMLLEKIKLTTVIGNPMDRNTNLGPLVTENQLSRL